MLFDIRHLIIDMIRENLKVPLDAKFFCEKFLNGRIMSQINESDW